MGSRLAVQASFGYSSSSIGEAESAGVGRWRSMAVLVLLAGLLALPPAAHAAGELDPSFDRDGRVETDFGGLDLGEAGLAIQADGKIVVAGRTNASANPTDFALARYNPDGSLDPAFGGDGRVVTDLGGDEFAFDVAIQADGKIVVAGDSIGDFALARFNSDGSLDPTFGAHGVTTNFGAFDSARGVAIQADGKIVATGFSNAGATYDFALARYNSNGTLDSTFHGDGRVLTDFGADEFAFGAAIQADGKIVAAGSVVARYNPDGSLDPSFDGDGSVVPGFGAFAVAIQADGKIVTTGSTLSDFALARYNPDGSLDPAFDGDGTLLTDFGSDDQAYAVAVQADGKIVAVGLTARSKASDFAVARYNPNGSLDLTFDRDGRVVTNFGADDSALGVAIQADGKIVAAGSKEKRGRATASGNFALARYLPDGAPAAP